MRNSPLTASPRHAANPANAILNYLYALLESEARLAAAAVGLDPGLRFLHVDAGSRDSLACDLIKPVRPEVDAYVLDWLRREPLKREWFFELGDSVEEVTFETSVSCFLNSRCVLGVEVLHLPSKCLHLLLADATISVADQGLSAPRPMP
jgi:hypothetical protein